jgi:type II secretion system protein N
MRFQNLKRISGYVGVFFLSFLVALYVTFPWAALGSRLTSQLRSRAGVDVRYGSIGPWRVSGLHLGEVEIRLPRSEDPMKIGSVSGRALLLPLLTGNLGVSTVLEVAQGKLEAVARKNGKRLALDGSADDIELLLLPGLKEKSGLPLEGKVRLRTDLEFFPETPEKTQGTVELRIEGFGVAEGGTIKGFPVPVLNLGRLDWKVPIEKGQIILKDQKIEQGDFETVLDGTVELRNPLPRSRLNLRVKFRPDPEFLKREPLLGTLLQNLNRAKGTDGFYSYLVRGTFNLPQATPGGGGI